MTIQNFSFYNPTKIYFGEGQIAALTRAISANKKIMLTYGGGSIFKNGVYDKVKAALKDRQLVEFGGIEVNPTYETLMKGVKIARENNIEFLLAVGGGSVIDGTKFMSAAIPYEGDNAWEAIVLGKERFKKATPFGTVLTLPATGTEMNNYAVISNAALRQKMSMGSSMLFPQFSVLDPTTTFSLPKKQIANGIADAFTHVIEQYLTTDLNAEIQDRFSESVLQTLIEVGPKTLAEPENYGHRANFMWAATVALNGWLSPGVHQDWSTHAIGHELTAVFGIDHARTLATILPYIMQLKKENKHEKLVQFAKRVWHLEGTDDELISQCIIKTREFYKSLEIPVDLKDYNLDKAELMTIKDRFEGKLIGENKDIDIEQVGQLLENSFYATLA